jgi:hypothetical protein
VIDIDVKFLLISLEKKKGLKAEVPIVLDSDCKFVFVGTC